jgi:electron transfer flavoprotein alpha subunit
MNTAGKIVVCGDLRTNRHWRNSLKVMTKAASLARSANAPVLMVLMGAGVARRNSVDGQNFDLGACVDTAHAAQDAIAHGAETVYCLEHQNLAVPRTDICAHVLAEFVRNQAPWLVLVPLTDFGRETAAICAQNCNAGLIADCTDLVFQDGQVVGRCPAWGGEIVADITLAPGWSTAFVTVQPHGAVLTPESGRSGAIETLVLDDVPMPSGRILKKRIMEPLEARKLEEADTVVAGGAGVGDIRGFGQVRELAAALGGEVGATRPAVMNHWVEEARLIGQTGKTIHPKLLISVGTSGAIQYTAGISEARMVVAINSDPTAPIFQWADLGLVGDAKTLLPLMIQEARQASMRRLADAACALDQEDTAPKAGFGALVRQLREARAWSPAELAQATGQTPDFIEQVESDRLSPPVSFILGMAQAMKVDPSTFLRKEEQAAIRDRRAQAYYQRTQEYSYTTLTPGAENSHLRAFMVTIEPHQAHKPVAYKHDGEEFIYLMEGRLELTLGSKVQKLRTGECIRFNSDVPHKLKSASNEPTRCLVVLYTI